jgi:hypothetical protein
VAGAAQFVTLPWATPVPGAAVAPTAALQPRDGTERRTLRRRPGGAIAGRFVTPARPLSARRALTAQPPVTAT